MGFRVIFTREVQIDIRYFIAIEAKEYGKGDVVAVLLQISPAFRAFLVGKIEPAAVFAMGKKFTVLALGAHIMRRQRIDLCNIRHGRDKGRADGSTGSDQIAIIIGMLYQLVGNVIQDAEPMAQDGRKFFGQAVFYNLGQGIAINLMSLVIAHLFQCFR